jgi:hypothetical protein
MIQGQLRSSILPVPVEVTPLKFRGDLRKEIEAVQATGHHMRNAHEERGVSFVLVASATRHAQHATSRPDSAGATA